MASKYIIFDEQYAVCFHDYLVHKDVASMMHTDIYGDWERKVPTSAGFFTVGVVSGVHGEKISVYAYGKSESLDIGMDADDKYLIAKALGIDYE